MNKINFLVVGTYRSGTTWLQKVFENHSQIFVPNEKEIFYFTRYYDRGVEWYHSFFKDPNKLKIKGEVCPSYFANSDAAKKIKNYNPDMKIVLIIRDPIDQIKSMRKLHLNRNIEKSNIINKEQIKNNYINNVLYYTNIKPFWESFPKKNILIVSYIELKQNPDNFLKTIYDFLEVEIEFDEMKKDVNKAFKPKSAFLEKIVSRFGDFLRNKNLYSITNFIKKTGFLKFVRKMNSSKTENKITITNDGIQYINDVMAEEMKKLNRLTNVDYSDILS